MRDFGRDVDKMNEAEIEETLEEQLQLLYERSADEFARYYPG